MENNRKVSLADVDEAKANYDAAAEEFNRKYDQRVKEEGLDEDNEEHTDRLVDLQVEIAEEEGTSDMYDIYSNLADTFIEQKLEVLRTSLGKEDLSALRDAKYRVVFREKLLKLLSNMEGKETLPCFLCRKETLKEAMHIWYHGDQDDLVCATCGSKLKHTDTAYTGMKVV